jgi:hypothetical protein
MAALLIAWPCALQQEGMVAISIAGTPLIGFVIHQGSRLSFERRRRFPFICLRRHGEFSHRSRRSLDILWDAIAIPCGFRSDEFRREKSFLVWETTFYGTAFPEAFRNHDRRVWHYILSFRSGFLSSVSAALFLILVLADEFWKLRIGFQPNDIRIIIAAAATFMIAGFILLSKGKQTLRGLMDQEIAMIYLYAGEFSRTAKQLSCLEKEWRQHFLR